MPIVKRTYTIDVTKKERKAFREDPLGHLDDIISKARSEYLHDHDPEPYLFVSDLETLTGPAFLAGIEDKVRRESVNYNGNSQIRRLILEDDLRAVVENREDETVEVNETDATEPQYRVTVDPLNVTIEAIEAEVEVVKPCQALHQLPVNTPVNVKREPYKLIEPQNIPVHGKTVIKLGGDVEGQINVLVTKDEKAKDRPKANNGPLHVPKTAAEVRAAVRPIVDAAYAVKSQRIADLCLAYSKQLIQDHGYTAEDINAKDRFPYREPRRLLYTEFERIFADDERVAQFVQSRDNTPEGDQETYIKGVYAIGYIDWLLEIAETLFAPFIAQA